MTEDAPQLDKNEWRPEEVVDKHNEYVKKYEPRTRGGVVAFLKNVVRGQFQKRPSEMRDEAEGMLEIRQENDREYAVRNLPALQAQAKSEAEAANKHINIDPPKAA